MKSILPLSINSLKNLRSYVNNKIYSIEIKIKADDVVKAAAASTQQSSNNDSKIIHQPIAAKLSKAANQSKDKKIQMNFNNVSQMDKMRRAQQMIDSLKYSLSLSNAITLNIRLKQLNEYLQLYPEVTNMCVRKNLISKLLKIRAFSVLLSNNSSIFDQLKVQQNKSKSIKLLNSRNYYRFIDENCRQILTLLGHTDPPNGRGIRILSIDGGGTRGILVIQLLRQIERRYGKPVHQIFDLICGTSTGSIIASLLSLKIPIDKIESYYEKISSILFKTDPLSGTGRLLWSHAYYDTNVYEKILKEIFGDTKMIRTRTTRDSPYILIISAIVNRSTLEPYLFRNYELHPSSKPLSHFDGSCKHSIWQAVRASSAAVGYFTEFTLNDPPMVLQDGGILLNNPTAVALHEVKLLWPNEQIQCVISLGSGRYQPPYNPNIESNNDSNGNNNKEVSLSSLKHKITRLIDSATDTEMVHRLIQDSLPNQKYYRMNPMLSEYSTIDENRPEKFQQMKQDALIYLQKNEHKFNAAIDTLKLERTYFQMLKDCIHKF